MTTIVSPARPHALIVSHGISSKESAVNPETPQQPDGGLLAATTEELKRERIRRLASDLAQYPATLRAMSGSLQSAQPQELENRHQAVMLQLSVMQKRTERYGASTDAHVATLRHAHTLLSVKFDAIALFKQGAEGTAVVQQHQLAVAETLEQLQASAQSLTGARAMLRNGEQRAIEATRSSTNSEASDHIGLIGDAEDALLDPYNEAMRKYLEFLQKWNDVLAMLKDAIIKMEDDGNVIVLDFRAMRDELYKLFQAYHDTPIATFDTQEEAQKFLDGLGLGGQLQLTMTADGKFGVCLNTQPIADLLNSMPPDKEVKWDMAKYNAWLDGKATTEKEFEHISQVLIEKLGRQNQLFQTVVKAISAALEQLAEILKTYARNTSG